MAAGTPTRPVRVTEAWWALAAAVVAFAVAAWSLHLWAWDTANPIDLGWDNTQISMQLRDIHDHGWYWFNPDLGFPAGQNGSWFPELNVLHVALIRLIDLVVPGTYTAGSLLFVLSFPLTAVAFHLLARSQGLGRPAGFVGGVLLANAPGHAERFGHLYLAQYWVVPVALWLVLEVGRGRPLLSPKDAVTPRWRGARTLVTVAAVLVVGLSGVYYVAFTLILLAAAAVARRVVGQPHRPVARPRGHGRARRLHRGTARPLPPRHPGRPRHRSGSGATPSVRVRAVRGQAHGPAAAVAAPPGPVPGVPLLRLQRHDEGDGGGVGPRHRRGGRARRAERRRAAGPPRRPPGGPGAHPVVRAGPRDVPLLHRRRPRVLRRALRHRPGPHLVAPPALRPHPRPAGRGALAHRPRAPPGPPRRGRRRGGPHRGRRPRPDQPGLRPGPPGHRRRDGRPAPVHRRAPVRPRGRLRRSSRPPSCPTRRPSARSGWRATTSSSRTSPPTTCASASRRCAARPPPTGCSPSTPPTSPPSPRTCARSGTAPSRSTPRGSPPSRTPAAGSRPRGARRWPGRPTAPSSRGTCARPAPPAPVTTPADGPPSSRSSSRCRATSPRPSTACSASTCRPSRGCPSGTSAPTPR